jgi:Sporulation and spore germination
MTPRPAVKILWSGGRSWWLAGGAAALVLAGGVWLMSTRLNRLLTAPPPGAATTATTPPTTTDARKIQATLFYVSDDGTALVPASRDVPYGATPGEQARQILAAEVTPPSDGHHSAIPVGTTVRAVFLTSQGEAYVDLGGAIATGQTGGSLDEALAVYAIVNAVTVNLPDIAGVQLLINGQQVDTLAGHLDLRHPLGKAMDFVRKGT